MKAHFNRNVLHNGQPYKKGAAVPAAMVEEMVKKGLADAEAEVEAPKPKAEPKAEEEKAKGKK